jgi:hypothetical protein
VIVAENRDKFDRKGEIVLKLCVANAQESTADNYMIRKKRKRVYLNLEDEGNDATENVGTESNNTSEVSGKLGLETGDNGACNGDQTVAGSGEREDDKLKTGETADLDGELDSELNLDEEPGNQAGQLILAVARDTVDSAEVSLGLADETDEDLDVLLDFSDLSSRSLA